MKPAKATVNNWKEIFSKRPKDALPPVYEDLEFLYDYVTEKRPHIILEFGSGCSTVVMAEAIVYYPSKDPWQKNWSGNTVVSFDNERRWLFETMKMIPSDLKHIVSLHLAMMLDVFTFQEIPAFQYFWGDIMSIYPDLIYLDGPELTKATRVTIDPLYYEHKMYPGSVIIVDGRDENVEFLKKHLLRKWAFRHENIGDNGMSIFKLEK